jgi:hypothetical protein
MSPRVMAGAGPPSTSVVVAGNTWMPGPRPSPGHASPSVTVDNTRHQDDAKER